MTVPAVIATGIANAIGDQINATIDDAVRSVTNPGAFLADDTPSVLLVPQQQVGRAFCRAWARTGVGNSPRLDAINAKACTPYLESLGEEPIPGSLASPFTGGQCAGVNYVLEYRAFRSDNTFIDVFVVTVEGPISAFSVVRSGDSQVRVDYTYGGGIGASFTQVLNNIFVRFQPMVRRQDGQADNCGNPPPDYTPPSPKPGLPPYSPVVPVPGTDDDTGVDFTFNPDGSVDISLPDLGVEVTIGAGPGDGAGGISPGDQGVPGGPESTGADGEAEGEAPAGSVLSGLLVTQIATTRAVSEFAAGVFRGVAYVYMGGDAGLDLIPGGAALREGQFIIAPVDYLTKWKVNANVGFQVSVTPYYREVAE